jgi:hypothetical protein
MSIKTKIEGAISWYLKPFSLDRAFVNVPAVDTHFPHE